jgi:hypothetical protein
MCDSPGVEYPSIVRKAPDTHLAARATAHDGGAWCGAVGSARVHIEHRDGVVVVRRHAHQPAAVCVRGEGQRDHRAHAAAARVCKVTRG